MLPRQLWSLLPRSAVVVRAAVVLGPSLLALEPGEARACSCATPFQNELRVGEGRIPSNAAGVTWWFPSNSSSDPLESFVTLERWEGQQRRPVSAVIEPFDAVYLIRPAERWSEGDRYRISVDAGASNGPPEKRFRIVEFEVSEPLEAGEELLLRSTSEARSKLLLVDFNGGCGAVRDAAFVDVYASGGSWEGVPLGLLFFETYVDGQRWQPKETLCQDLEPGTSWLGRNRDRMVADCSGGAEPGVALPLGAHQVRIEARLPGTNVVFSTNEGWVGLFCRDEADRSPSDSQNDGAPMEAVAAMDSAIGLDALPGAALPGTDVAGTDRDSRPASASSRGGCTLSSAPSEHRAGYAAIALLALAVLGGKRRRSSGPGHR